MSKVRIKFSLPVVVARHYLLRMYRQGHKRQIILEARCYKDNHDLHITFGILQFHPGMKLQSCIKQVTLNGMILDSTQHLENSFSTNFIT